MTIPTEHYLAVTAIGPFNPKLVDRFSKAIANCDCNILSTRMTMLGSEFALIALITGNWGGIAKLETIIPTIEKKLDITTTIKRTKPVNSQQNSIVYVVQIVAIDRPNILNQIANFFYQENISIEDVNSHTYKTHRSTKMVAMTINVDIAADTHISSLRDKFLSYCDTLNIDAGIEPLKE